MTLRQKEDDDDDHEYSECVPQAHLLLNDLLNLLDLLPLPPPGTLLTFLGSCTSKEKHTTDMTISILHPIRAEQSSCMIQTGGRECSIIVLQ